MPYLRDRKREKLITTLFSSSFPKLEMATLAMQPQNFTDKSATEPLITVARNSISAHIQLQAAANFTDKVKPEINRLN